jgi:hypothetical protein
VTNTSQGFEMSEVREDMNIRKEKTKSDDKNEEDQTVGRK